MGYRKMTLDELNFEMKKKPGYFITNREIPEEYKYIKEPDIAEFMADFIILPFKLLAGEQIPKLYFDSEIETAFRDNIVKVDGIDDAEVIEIIEKGKDKEYEERMDRGRLRLNKNIEQLVTNISKAGKFLWTATTSNSVRDFYIMSNKVYEVIRVGCFEFEVYAWNLDKEVTEVYIERLHTYLNTDITADAYGVPDVENTTKQENRSSVSILFSDRATSNPNTLWIKDSYAGIQELLGDMTLNDFKKHNILIAEDYSQKAYIAGLLSSLNVKYATL